MIRKPVTVIKTKYEQSGPSNQETFLLGKNNLGTIRIAHNESTCV